MLHKMKTTTTKTRLSINTAHMASTTMHHNRCFSPAGNWDAPSAASFTKSTVLTLLVVVSLFASCVVSSPMQAQHQQQLQHQEPQQQQQQQQQHQQQSTVRIQQCREGCFEKFATKDILCQQNAECLTCWDECAKPPPPKINKSIRETWSLHTVSMLQQDSLVLVDVAWAPLSTPNQCLVTWEVSGGGLMGNLLTESFNVQLSLWPDTKYRVQVTCKNKLTGTMSRSLPLTIDTAEAVAAPEFTAPQSHKSISANTNAHPPSSKLLPIGHIIDSQGNSIMPHHNNNNNNIDTNIEAQDIASVLPYEEDDVVEPSDQSAETINQHTNFIFNWHAKNNDISAIEPLQKPDLNILTIAALSDMQKPLLFGVVAGTLLLLFVLLMYICMMRQQRLPSDKAALIAEDAHAVVVSLPPAAAVGRASSGGGASCSGAAATMAKGGDYSDEGCSNAAICSRNALKV